MSIRTWLDWLSQQKTKINQLVINEKTSHSSGSLSITLIYPLTLNASLPGLKSKFRQLYNKVDSVLLFSDEMNKRQIFRAIMKAKVESSQLTVFISDWDEQLFTLIADKIDQFYLLVETSEKEVFNEKVTQYLDFLATIPIPRKEIALLHTTSAHMSLPHKWLVLEKFSLHHHVRMSHEEDFKRLIRFMTGNAFVVVMGGGGAKGLLHLGVIKALLEHNIPIDAIGGTSIGANIGACYALCRDYLTTARHVMTLRNATKEALTFKHMTWPNISLYSSHPVTEELMQVFDKTCIENLWIPYFAVSTNTMTDKEHIHRQGLLWEAARSSAALPGIFPPVICEGNMLFDGGIVNNLPVDVMRSIIGKGHTILAVSLSKKTKKQINYKFPPVLTFKNSLLSKLRLAKTDYVYPPFIETITEALLLGSSFTEKANENLADILIKPDLTNFKSLHILEKDSMELIELGYNETVIAIEAFRRHSPNFSKYC